MKKLTRRTRELIKEAVITSNSTNRYELCQIIADNLSDKYKSENGEINKKLEYQTSRMNLDTTKKILAAIDSYFYIYADIPTLAISDEALDES